nr:MAG TPA: hypothetical protein [Caudoviricetes sp.]
MSVLICSFSSLLFISRIKNILSISFDILVCSPISASL